MRQAQTPKRTRISASVRPTPRPRPSCCWLLRPGGVGAGEKETALLPCGGDVMMNGEPKSAIQVAGARAHTGAHAAVVSGNEAGVAVDTAATIAASTAAVLALAICTFRFAHGCVPDGGACA